MKNSIVYINNIGKPRSSSLSHDTCLGHVGVTAVQCVFNGTALVLSENHIQFDSHSENTLPSIAEITTTKAEVGPLKKSKSTLDKKEVSTDRLQAKISPCL